MIDKTDKAIADILGKLKELAEVHGNEAAQLAVKAAQIDAIQTIVAGIACLIAAGICWRVAMMFWRKGVSAGQWDGDGWYFGAVMSACGCAGLVTAAAVLLLQITAWIGLYDPKLYLAHRILERVL